jgi:hypothetical protein
VAAFIKGLRPTKLQDLVRLEHCKDVEAARKAAYRIVSDNAKYAAKTYDDDDPRVKASVPEKNRERDRDRPSAGVCFNCGRPGHKARDCRQGRAAPGRHPPPLPTNTARQPVAPQVSLAPQVTSLIPTRPAPSHSPVSVGLSTTTATPAVVPTAVAKPQPTCYNCGKVGHKSNVCKEPKKM